MPKYNVILDVEIALEVQAESRDAALNLAKTSLVIQAHRGYDTVLVDYNIPAEDAIREKTCQTQRPGLKSRSRSFVI